MVFFHTSDADRNLAFLTHHFIREFRVDVTGFSVWKCRLPLLVGDDDVGSGGFALGVTVPAYLTQLVGTGVTVKFSVGLTLCTLHIVLGKLSVPSGHL
jgi:hypothetical protein